ncbi:MAG: hypothetical protein ACM3VT_06310 [Solirubrobacterales bacterium]
MWSRSKNGRRPVEPSAPRTPGSRPLTEPFNNERDALLLAGDAPARRDGRHYRRYLWLIALAAYVVFLLYRGLTRHDGTVSPGPWDGGNRLGNWLLGLALGGFREFSLFVPVGFLAAIAIPRSSRRGRRFLLEILTLLAAGCLTIVACAGEITLSWPSTIPPGLASPLLGSFFGVWTGLTWLRGWRARLWFLPKVAALISVPILCLGVLVWLSLEAKPLSVDAAQVTSEEKRRLVSLFRSSDPRSLEEGQTHTLTLTGHDLDVLLAWGLSIGLPSSKAVVGLEQDSASISLSAGIPFRGGTRYLNLILAGGARMRENALAVTVERCTVGAMRVPHWLLDLCLPWATSRLNHDPRFRPFVRATREIAIGPDCVDVVYGRVKLPPGYRDNLLASALFSEEVLASARVQIAHLLAVVGQVPKPRPTFDVCMETAFALARDRARERDPVIENQAAILALASLLGHSRVEEFLGPVKIETRDRAARRALLQVSLRDRADWTKHFFVSAAIALISNTVVSDAAGLLKEELDAGRGGSGFSFTDLLADRAGTTFAVCATRDRAAALTMQNRIAGGFRVDEFFPPAEDLPEGIPDAQLQQRYGGVGGQGYREMVAEIERRVAACAAYR